MLCMPGIKPRRIYTTTFASSRVPLAFLSKYPFADSETQETRVMITTDIKLTHELHVIRAHQLHYTSLLDDFEQHINFITKSSNPMLENSRFTDQDRTYSKDTMRSECRNLLIEIERLKKGLKIQQKRLTNVIGLVCSFSLPQSRLMGLMGLIISGI